MKNPNNSHKSRRNFLKSSGLFLTILGIFWTSVFGGSKTSLQGFESLFSSLIPTGSLQPDVVLPDGVSAVWELSKAYRQTTPTREQICINGLWQWKPGTSESDQIPTTNWGYFKVPGYWPGIINYMQKESQRLFVHPAWKDQPLSEIGVAWYQREITIPANWKNRHILLNMEYLNSSAVVYIDGTNSGELLFPSGELDLTSICTAGNKYVLSAKVTALPLQDVVAVYSDSNAPRQGKGMVERRGLCGDVFLCSTPKNERISDVKVITSFRKSEITFNIELKNLSPHSQYILHSVAKDNGTVIADFKSKIFKVEEVNDGRISFTEPWIPKKLWDIHTPENMFDLTVTLLENNHKLLDTIFPIRFGFREFWIDGRDFFLNGTRIFLSAVPFDNAQYGTAWATYEAAKESMRRLMSFGINFVYTHNYGCEPGTHLSFAEILKAADDTGMLISLSQPHFGQYEWKNSDADQKNGYAHHAKFYTQVAAHHPSVVFYSMNHNACGYTDDMNPDRIDGLSRPDSPWSANNTRKAMRTEAIVAALDPGRIIYHHSSGNLGSMHTSNFYPNWVPIQELSDWFEHWATIGIKPLFLCEFGAPFTWDWGLYRGWYKGKREFGSAPAPWEFCLAEWNAQFLGDEAFKISELEKENLRWEAKRFQEGAVWYRWDYPYNFDDGRFNERNPVLKMHLVDQWRAFRTWGMSANSPWNYDSYWQLSKGISDQHKDFMVDWENLQQPGLSPDFCDRANRMDMDIAFKSSDWIPTAAEALLKNNMPLLAYIGGKPTAFTSKDHNYVAGSQFGKQLIIINNSRRDVSCDCSWTLNLPELVKNSKSVTIATGQQERIPLKFNLPDSLSSGIYKISATVKFSNGDIQEDTFNINVLPVVIPEKNTTNIALFDPKGETARLLENLGIRYQSIDGNTESTEYELLIIGKEALTLESKGPDVENVRNGLKVIMFEQTSEVLEKRFGFRVQEYGLRQVFKRISDHPTMAGLSPENLRDWQGSATILSSKLKFETNDSVYNGSPTVRWCDIPVTRIWRCGNRGNVASVLIEKPTCGNFTPILDGGYSLQYSPLLEYREGKGLVMFCQMDVTGRTEPDPAAALLVKNIVSYVSGWKPEMNRQAVYAGDSVGFEHLEKAGVLVTQYRNKKLSAEQVLIMGPGGGRQLSSDSKTIANWIKSGGRILAIGLDQTDVDAFLPLKVTMKMEEHISAYFETFSTNSVFAAVGPADVHNRAPKMIPLLSNGAEMIGNGVLAKAKNTNIFFCQLVPWECDYSNEKHNVKQTYRRSSFLLNRIMGNMGVESSAPLLARFNSPVDTGNSEKRWLDGFYLDQPEEWDDPYRFFRW